ncbi:uncharacterized protein PRCAT00003888001 [Priceomyces carsonii]|uniref:uncharacterized protein n=1 Tax=Priceomyces carsonii TaxID=28549 RepID=UPI002ED890C3|nr:unnamed protein product [Priceomyces carsonii]
MSTFGGKPSSSTFHSSESSKSSHQRHGGTAGERKASGNGSASGNRRKNTKSNGTHGLGGGNNHSQRNNDRTAGNQEKKRYGGPKKASKQQQSKDDVDISIDLSVKDPKVQKAAHLQQYTDDEVRKTGSLFHNPESFGFKKSHNRSLRPRPKPRYMISQPRMLVTPPFSPDPWDIQNQENMRSKEISNSGKDYQGLYEEFQKMREVERKKMEELGLVDAENTSKDLNDAIVFRGTCLEMCPTFERVRRALENNVKYLEKDPNTNKISHERAVKAFSRPAAGQPPPLPSDVRPPHVLVKTLDYLVDNIVDKLPEAHSFVWDRTRSIRQDFIYQNFYGPEAIDCNERIVRIHLLSLHVMAGSDVEYSQQQELEQFNKALQTLVEIYQDVRNHGGRSPNEAEFRAYYLLSHFRDPELEREIQELPDDILQNRLVQLALMFRTIMSQNNIVDRGYVNKIGALNFFVEFFKIAYSEETPFLVGCLLETHFNEIRFYALKAMSRCYHTKGKAYPAESLQAMLGFDSMDKLTKFVSYYEVDLIYENGEVLVDLFNKDKLETKYKLSSLNDKPKLLQAYSTQLNFKTEGKRMKDFVNSGNPNVDLNLKFMSQNSEVQAAPDLTYPSGGGVIKSKSFNDFPSTTKSSSELGTNSSFGRGSQFSFANSGPAVPSSSQTLSDFLKPSINHVNINIPGALGTKEDAQSQPQAALPVKESGSIIRTPSLVSNFPTKKNEAPKFSFGLERPSENQETPAAFSGSFSIPLKDDGQTSVVKNEQHYVQEPKIPESSLMTAEVKQKFLKDHPLFERGVTEVFNDIFNRSITSELYATLPKIIRHENMNRERNDIIELFTEELFSAFLAENTYQVTLEARATYFRDKMLKVKVIRKLADVGTKLKIKQEIKKKKLEELNAVSFGRHTKRKTDVSHSSDSSFEASKRRRTGVAPISEIYEKQKEVRHLWEPLDLRRFLDQCTKNLKIGIDTKDIEIKLLLVVEDWSSAYSKWLNTKLALNINREKMIYENSVKNAYASLKITSLPSNKYLTSEFFSNTSFIIYECGILQKGTKYKSTREKLASDKNVLNKIISIVRKYSYFKIQILILFYDDLESNLSTHEISQILEVKQYRQEESIQDIILCDMTRKGVNVNDMFAEAFDTISENFKGKLTLKGAKKKDKLTKRKKASSSAERESHEQISNSTFGAQEAKLISKARSARKYDYLSKHMSLSTPDTSRMSANDSSVFMTANNVSGIGINQSLSNLNNSTFLNFNNSIGDSSFNNVSNLTGFGNGVIEESTPFNSPKSKKFAKPGPNNVPRSLEQLRELTASIRAKYKK